jgi:hypothetical protein
MAPIDSSDPPPGHAVCPARCETCGTHAVGVDAGFPLHVVALLIPCSFRTLRRHLSVFKAEYPPRYRRRGSTHRWIRILYASEVLRIRARMFREGARRPSLLRLVESAVELRRVW